MKKFIATYLFLLIGILAFSQEETSLNTIPNKKVYFTDPAELILQFSQIDIQDNTARNGIRASYFTNIPYYMNINFNNNFGIMPGVSIKNIGIKTKDEIIDSVSYYKVIRRVFTAGISAAAKIGMFNKGLWLYGGGGVDWAFHYRQKFYEKTDKKHITKKGEWWSKATPNVIPSVFVGVQTPIGINVKATYYFNDFLNQKYKGTFGDFSKITQSQLFTITFALILKEMKDSSALIEPLEQPSRKEKSIEL
ncbi:MAG: hypothetical protein J6V74_00160 [Bacteroidales bacterium]|nr:hypothetical protein [Bacteroidales bacterium]